MGWIPADTKLTPRPATLPAWDTLSAEERKFQARLMEVYAGFFEQTDTEAGRIIDELDKEGIRQNTLVFYILSDNGASAEGIEGTISELLAQNGIPTTVAQQMTALNQICVRARPGAARPRSRSGRGSGPRVPGACGSTRSRGSRRARSRAPRAPPRGCAGSR